ncbi:MAG: hypothetical protein HQL44_02740 [Alphaproteobacteria bacterium]|nr:hypothetical protein [Alphaproteobacteria bacterium]
MESLILRRNAERLNLECLCKAVSDDKLAQSLDRRAGKAGFGANVLESRPHLFSRTPVFVTRDDAAMMADMVKAIERVSRMPAWIQAALEDAPETAKRDFKTKSVFMGYDFHIGPQGPLLIEVNTNAGGAYLNLAILDVLDACCEDAGRAMADHHPDVKRLDETFVEIFRAEMQAQKLGQALAFAAIVDDDPENQYLLPEFELVQASFLRAGIASVIADPGSLDYRDGVLSHQGRTVDLVYNRLVDFGLDEERHAQLRMACLDGAVVVTPSPRAHALLANKRHLTLLSDADALLALGASADDAAMISAHVPRTILVTPENADELWAGRKRWFFKPASGHAGKAAYRGDKMTRGVWQDILKAESYVAQEVAPPAERGVMVEGIAARMKSDIRLYSYDGNGLLMAARLYQGQTTNFRTQGGGFAPVLVV